MIDFTSLDTKILTQNVLMNGYKPRAYIRDFTVHRFEPIILRASNELF